MEQELKELKLAEVKPNKWNFRHNFSGPKFDELVDSIRSKGVIQPILVRPVSGKIKYEIVFGERRYRAAKAAFKKKGGNKTIPAIIRKLSDDEAFDLMVIENLQREDLSELEEAQGFKAYLDKNGDEALPHLAERTDISPAYIRRRVSVLGLPEPVLGAWDKGEIRYGYLEQLARLDDENEIIELFQDIVNGCWEITSIKDLKRIIDEKAVKLEHALFDLDEQGCLACHSNSDVQLRLFEIDAEKSKCVKPDCFWQKQKTWLVEHWQETKYHKKFKTNGFRLASEVDHRQSNVFHQAKLVGKECKKCEAFVTLFSGLLINTYFERVCIGESSCFKKICARAEAKQSEKSASQGGAGQGDQPEDKPRVEWHGGYFREAFYREKIPQRFEGLSARGLKATQLALFALIKSGGFELQNWFMKKYAASDDDEYYCVGQTELFKPISEMTVQQASQVMKEAALQLILYDNFYADGRRVVADHVGIDLSKEWMFTEEYLKKKHIPEILGMGERFGIFSDPKAKKYLADELGKSSFKGCKKKELIKVILESGVDLAGKVPDEILNQSS